MWYIHIFFFTVSDLYIWPMPFVFGVIICCHETLQISLPNYYYGQLLITVGPKFCHHILLFKLSTNLDLETQSLNNMLALSLKVSWGPFNEPISSKHYWKLKHHMPPHIALKKYFAVVILDTFAVSQIWIIFLICYNFIPITRPWLK